MAIPQGKLREALFHCLYALEHGSDSDEIIGFMMDHMLISQKNAKSTLSKAVDVRTKLFEVDPLIQQYAKDYHLNRISSVEKNALRLAVYEMLFEQETPKIIILSEGVRLCNIFGSPEGSKFVNGILHAIFKSLTPQEVVSS